MKKPVDVVYVVASKLGSIGMGTTGYNAIKGVDKSNLSYNIFCRGYDPSLGLKRKSVKSFGYLEYLSLPLRFMQKKLHMNIKPFKLINKLLGDRIYNGIPKSKIYHTWIGQAPKAVMKAKKNGAILVLEGANSHPLNVNDILNEECRLLDKKEFLEDRSQVKKDVKIFELFDYVMCPSDFVYDSFLKYGFKKEQLVKMPYGVDITKYKVRKKKDKTFRAVFVGSIQMRKGLHYLLEAWNNLKLKDAELVLVGRVYPDISDLMEKYKGNSSIKFIGFNKNPGQFLQNADVFVSPSLEEGSALTCYEAMATGLPLIATYNTGSIARDGKEGFIIPIRDVKAMQKKIKYMYDHRKEMEKMGKAARKRVEGFTWDDYSKRLLNKYKEILA